MKISKGNLNLVRSNAWAAVMLLMLAFNLFGQESTTGTIVGTVKDANGAVVPGASVTITNKATGAKRTLNTANDGEFSAPGLLPARYDLSVEKQGFKITNVQALELKINQTARFDIVLQTGEVGAVVTVDGGDVLLETETGTQGQVISQRQIAELPLNGRNLTQLATLGAGVSPPPAGTIQNQQYGNRQQFVTVDGGRDSSTNYLVDGIGARSMRFNNLSLQLNVDAIQEFKVNRNSFSAEFGQGQSVVTVVTKSGSNEVHGSGYEFLRNDAFDARNFFDAAKPDLKRNQFGGTLGAPIIKNKAFIFGAYEGLRSKRGASSIYQTIPTAFLNGDFSSLPDPIPFQPPGAPFPIGFLCPAAACRPVNPATGTLFAGGIIPQASFSQFATVLKRIIPTTANGAAVTRIRNFTDNFNQATVRADQTLSEKHNLFERYIWYKGEQFTTGLAPQANPQEGQNFALQSSYTLTNTMVNEFKFGYNYANHSVIPDTSQITGNPTQDAGLRNLIGAVNSAEFGYPVAIIPAFGVNSSDSQNGFINQGAKEKIFTVGDNISKVFKSSTLKFGAEIQLRKFDQFTDVLPRGLFVFVGIPSFAGTGSTTNAVADFLLGRPISAQGQSGDTASNYKSKFFGTYVQNDWRVTDRLTVNLGIRYEYSEPWKEKNNLEGFFNPATSKITFHKLPANIPASLAGAVDSNTSLVPAGIIFPDRNNFAPRVGLAWRPFGENTVIRAGFGVFYDNTNLNELQFTRIIPPFSFVQAPSTPILTSTLFPSLSQLTSFPAPFSLDPKNRTPYSEQYNLSVQHTFAKNWLAEIGYSGSQSHKLWKRFDQNQIDPRTGLRPFPTFSVNMLTSVNVGNANYHSGYAKIERRFSDGLFLLANYTYGKTIDNGSGELQTNETRYRGNLSLERGRSLFDIRQRFTASAGFELPFGKGKKYLANASGAANYLLGGWSVNSILYLATGSPFLVNDGGATASGGDFIVRYPNRVCNGTLSNPTRTKWFDTSCFVRTAVGVNNINLIGNSGRNILNGPGRKSVDLSFTKNTRFGERYNFQFRAEFFNIFNLVNFGTPNADLGTASTFGLINTAADPRQIQLGFKFIF
jgi:Carboxypeptidase regulatory-like domain/TonB dependent receptor/TonB-dependent Receptor Plug Domain